MPDEAVAAHHGSLVAENEIDHAVRSIEGENALFALGLDGFHAVFACGAVEMAAEQLHVLLVAESPAVNGCTYLDRSQNVLEGFY